MNDPIWCEHIKWSGETRKQLNWNVWHSFWYSDLHQGRDDDDMVPDSWIFCPWCGKERTKGQITNEESIRAATGK